MPYYYFEEIKTPLLLIGIRFYRNEDKEIWMKIGSKPRRLLFKK